MQHIHNLLCEDSVLKAAQCKIYRQVAARIRTHEQRTVMRLSSISEQYEFHLSVTEPFVDTLFAVWLRKTVSTWNGDLENYKIFFKNRSLHKRLDVEDWEVQFRSQRSITDDARFKNFLSPAISSSAGLDDIPHSIFEAFVTAGIRKEWPIFTNIAEKDVEFQQVEILHYLVDEACVPGHPHWQVFKAIIVNFPVQFIDAVIQMMPLEPREAAEVLYRLLKFRFKKDDYTESAIDDAYLLHYTQLLNKALDEL
jgi:hypothetical protein